MTVLLVGFDSAWTTTNSGAVVGALYHNDHTFQSLGTPEIVDNSAAGDLIRRWQAELVPTSTIVLIDQPTIVKNADGQRPVENIVGSSVCRRYGGMQPANTARKEMFGKEAPVWRFLSRFGGAADPLAPVTNTCVLETYPVLAMIALDWMLSDSRILGRLPKYNPKRKKTFSISDWQYVCNRLFPALHERGLTHLARWVSEVGKHTSPTKPSQDGLDACLCLLVAVYLVEQKNCLMVGDRDTGYIVVPYSNAIRAELDARCQHTGRDPAMWVRVFKMKTRLDGPVIPELSGNCY
jgi:predicted RNase H-like nuclease